MPNIFDNIARNTFKTCGVVFGYDAVWAPSTGADQLSGKVLFKDPSKDEKAQRLKGAYADVELTPAAPYMEFLEVDFPGLRAAVQAGNSEYITINGTEYYVATVPKIWDGNTLRADLEEV